MQVHGVCVCDTETLTTTACLDIAAGLKEG